jgi:hypothetical protein
MYIPTDAFAYGESPMLHPDTFEYLKPTQGQLDVMNYLRQATASYASIMERALDDGPDKTYILRRIRETAMWINVALIRNADGSPRSET